MPGLVSTGMGDHVQTPGFNYHCRKHISVSNQSPRSTQPDHHSGGSTNQRMVMLYCYGIKAGMVGVCVAGKTV